MVALLPLDFSQHHHLALGGERYTRGEFTVPWEAQRGLGVTGQHPGA